jgi:hypothetical protein
VPIHRPADLRHEIGDRSFQLSVVIGEVDRVDLRSGEHRAAVGDGLRRLR